MRKQFEPYRPSNGSEGRRFEAEFCDRCAHDDGEAVYPDPGCCVIRMNAFVFDKREEGFPRDTWVYFNGRPMCLAFRERRGGDGDEPYTSPDPSQLNLFDLNVLDRAYVEAHLESLQKP